MPTTRASIVAFVLVTGVVRGDFQAPPAPSLVIVNARVFTGVADRPWAEAIMMIAITNANNPAEAMTRETGTGCLHLGIGVRRA